VQRVIIPDIVHFPVEFDAVESIESICSRSRCTLRITAGAKSHLLALLCTKLWLVSLVAVLAINVPSFMTAESVHHLFGSKLEIGLRHVSPPQTLPVTSPSV
jgi:hypothetical protein